MQIDEKQLYRYIGERLQARRLELGLTQAQLAQRIGMRRTSITNIEAGRQRVPLHTLYWLGSLLGIDATTILPAPESVMLNAEVPETPSDFDLDRVPPRTASLVRELLEDPEGA